MTTMNEPREGRSSPAGQDGDEGSRSLMRRVLASSDITAVTHAMSDAYSDVTVRIPRADRHLYMRLETFSLPNVKLGNLTMSASTVRSRNYPWYAICLPASGTIRISSDGLSSVVSGDRGVVVSPGKPVEVEYLTEQCRMQTILIDRPDLETELSAMLGRPVTAAPRFDAGLDLARDGSSSLRRAVALLTEDLVDAGGIASVPVMASRLGRLVIAGLLVSQPHNYSELLTDGAAAACPRTIRIALGVIEERPAEIETVSDIAKAVGLSVRALDEGFRRYVGLSPMAYLRQVRLAGAHHELLSADPDRTTASAVARNWNFWHYGRFAAAYFTKYGRTPAETLRNSGDS